MECHREECSGLQGSEDALVLQLGDGYPGVPCVLLL